MGISEVQLHFWLQTNVSEYSSGDYYKAATCEGNSSSCMEIFNDVAKLIRKHIFDDKHVNNS